MRSRIAAWAALLTVPLTVLSGCEPQRPAPVRVMALIQGNRGVYEPKEISLTTVRNVVSLEGAAATITGGARIIVDFNDPLFRSSSNLTDDQVAAVFIKSRGSPPRASYVERQGVLWPADFHTWNLVSTYYHYEKAFEYFQLAGVPGEELAGAPVHYFPHFAFYAAQSGTEVVQRDNAFYFSPLRSFILLPFERLQQVPLAMNYGVLAHEYSHRVFNRRVYGGRAFPEAFVRWGNSPALNILKSLDEGLADFHAYAATCHGSFGCDPRWLEDSVPSAVADVRDLSATRCMTASLRDGLLGMQNTVFIGQELDYRIGTVIAAALYQTGRATDSMDQVAKSVILAYSDDTPATPGMAQVIQASLLNPNSFSLPAMLDTILSHTGDPNIRQEMCNRFLDEVRINRAALPHCPQASFVGTRCPAFQ
jgi:hypothetical protein